MKLSTGDWHRWFAWRPVRLDNNDLVWLEWVEKRYSEYLFGNSYRKIEESK